MLPILVRFSSSVTKGIGRLLSHSSWFPSLSPSTDMECWPPYWADNWLTAALNKIVAWCLRWRNKRQGEVQPTLHSAAAIYFRYFFVTGDDSALWCRPLVTFFPELSVHSRDPSAAHNYHLRSQSLQPLHDGCLFVTWQCEIPSLPISALLWYCENK